MHWVPAYVGLGSNLQDPPARIDAAFEALGSLPHSLLITRSPHYSSRPMGSIEQPEFCNAVAAMLTQLEVHAFFEQLRSLEVRLGRTPPRERWGPRVIDLDLLVFGSQVINEESLHLPHRGIVQRNFVLYPLCDVAPDLLVPGAGRVADLARAVSGEGIWRTQ
ncbi:MAG: 2-amino-4-hydroxy-6-hydroxymethyldihydropteridine diphosphokinase [Steroidobacteraceae bacterium]|jgi:2-amino-4-hydroxy-6-hydroxymethyldihydropteridine diphosphokinase